MKVKGHDLFTHSIHPFKDADSIPLAGNYQIVFRDAFCLADIKVQSAQVVRTVREPRLFFKRQFDVIDLPDYRV